MPVTKTAKRALRGSKNKETVNKLIVGKLEVAVRQAKKIKNCEKSKSCFFCRPRRKKEVIHKNKAARIKSQLSKLLPQKRKFLQRKNREIVASFTPFHMLY